jgi:VIT1/CCC1 family predicted Fe2+/Mn2+ transporter
MLFFGTGVLGAIDGLVSVASLMIGANTASRHRLHWQCISMQMHTEVL